MVSKHIGIVAVSPEGSALCYRKIFRHASNLFPSDERPRVTLHNEPFADYVAAVLQDDWQRVGTMLLRSAKVLADAGADFAVVPDNVMQHGIHFVQDVSPLPFLTMTDLVSSSLTRDTRAQVALIGTKLVMLGSTYQTHLGMAGIKVVVPTEEDRDTLDTIIFREHVYGVTRPESKERIVRIVEALGERGCEGVILGWSEAPLVFADGDLPLPMYEPTDILAEGAVRMCMTGELPS